MGGVRRLPLFVGERLGEDRDNKRRNPSLQPPHPPTHPPSGSGSSLSCSLSFNRPNPWMYPMMNVFSSGRWVTGMDDEILLISLLLCLCWWAHTFMSSLLKSESGYLVVGIVSRCKHYRRRCMLRAPCCNEIFSCRHCHNEATVSSSLRFLA